MSDNPQTSHAVVSDDDQQAFLESLARVRQSKSTYRHDVTDLGTLGKSLVGVVIVALLMRWAIGTFVNKEAYKKMQETKTSQVTTATSLG